jgi:hypothetical protein
MQQVLLGSLGSPWVASAIHTTNVAWGAGFYHTTLLPCLALPGELLVASSCLSCKYTCVRDIVFEPIAWLSSMTIFDEHV